MHRRTAVLVISLLFATGLFAKDVYLSVGGSIGNFRTDARIFNPSYTKDITITARYLPAGNGDNSGAAPKNITVAKRAQVVYDDVVQSLFGGGAALGAVRLTSDDDFVASQRIYANEPIGTLGQFVPGLDVSTALKKGVLIQLKSNGGRGEKGTFRTNWGGVNPNATVANIAFKLYGKDNLLAGTNNLTLQPFGVFSPNSIATFFGVPSTTDISDTWLSFESDQPIFIYGSVLDNGSEDPTFIPAAEDTGVAPPPPAVKTVTISATSGGFTVSGPALAPGDRVRFVATNASGEAHGFRFFDPDGNTLVTFDPIGATASEITITLPARNGDYPYICTRPTCSTHNVMFGQLRVQ